MPTLTNAFKPGFFAIEVRADLYSDLWMIPANMIRGHRPPLTVPQAVTWNKQRLAKTAHRQPLIHRGLDSAGFPVNAVCALIEPPFLHNIGH